MVSSVIVEEKKYINQEKSMETEQKIQRNREISEAIIGFFKAKGLNYSEAKGILSDVSYELGKRSERNLV